MKSYPGTSHHYASVVVFSFLLLLCGCFLHPDYSIALPNGYKLSRIWKGAHTIVNERNFLVVGLTVQKYAVVGNIVTGYVSDENMADVPETLRGKTGYFVLDTATANLQDGLGEDKWRNVLELHNITSLPALKTPSRKDAKWF